MKRGVSLFASGVAATRPLLRKGFVATPGITERCSDERRATNVCHARGVYAVSELLTVLGDTAAALLGLLDSILTVE